MHRPQARSLARPLARVRRPLGGSLLALSLALGCGSSTPEQVAERHSLANRLSGPSLGQGGSAGAATGQAGGADATSAGGGGGNAAGGSNIAGSNIPGSGGMPPAAMEAPPTPVEGSASGPPQECDGPELANGVFGAPAPENGVLVDFASYTPRVGTSGGSWGDAALGQITGGTSVYSLDSASALSIGVGAGELELQATLGAGAYTGVVLWFTPCVNAVAFGGLRFPVRGDLGGARLLVKAQTSPDYPVDVTNAKGKCVYENDADKFKTCVQPTASLSELGADPLTLGWDQFVGGTPLAAPDPAQLLGLELQFTCPAASCVLDVSIGTVEFLPPG